MSLKTVFVGRCNSYSREIISEVIREGLAAISPGEELFKRGERFLLKPNLLSASHPSEAITTHPEFVSAVGRVVHSGGAEVAIGDSSGPRSLDPDVVYSLTGMREAAFASSGSLLHFPAYGIKMIRAGGVFSSTKIPISSVYNNFSGVVNLPKIKTHNLMGFTGAVKNLFGFVSGLSKLRCHTVGFRASDFAEVLVSLYREVSPFLTIVDGIVGMEGNGPASGRPRELGIVIIGKDALAVDVVIADLLGVDPSKDPLFKAFKRSGIEVPGINDLSVVGVSLSLVRPTGFVLPGPFRLGGMVP